MQKELPIPGEKKLQPAVEKKPQDRSVQIYSTKRIRKKKFRHVEVGEYGALIGEIEARCNIMLYGPSGGGKTVFAIRLANYLSKKYGKTLYASHEEDTNKSVVDRINEWSIDSEKMYFAGRMTFEQFCKKVKSNKYRVCVIDSLQYAEFTYDQLKKFREMFKKRHIILIMVSFGTAMSKTLGFNDHLHASDVKLYFKDGYVTSHGRYIGKPVKQKLFKIEEIALEGELFNETTKHI